MDAKELEALNLLHCSPIDENLLRRYANWSESKFSGMMVLMCAMTSPLKHFVATDVSATGR